MKSSSWFQKAFLVFVPFTIFLPASGQQNSIVSKPVIESNPVVTYFYKFPLAVENVRTDSIVGVEVSWLTLRRGIQEQVTKAATGFVVGDGVVLTALHTFSDIPQIWEADSTKIKVYDGKNSFSAEVLSLNPAYDLAAILVGKTDENIRFIKKPVVVASQLDKKNLPDNFYSFGFMQIDKNIYFPIRFGQYVMETNLINDDIFPVVVGMVLGKAEHGFSGAPLMGPDGVVFGMLSMTSDIYTHVTPVEQISYFLNETFRMQKENKSRKPE
jgi:hypothetical protein